MIDGIRAARGLKAAVAALAASGLLLFGCAPGQPDSHPIPIESLPAAPSPIPPATCTEAPSDAKPSQQFYRTTFHADLDTLRYGSLAFDRGVVRAATATTLTVTRNGDARELTFAITNPDAYQCHLTVEQAPGTQVSIASQAGTATVIWPTTTQTPTLLKVAYHGVFDYIKSGEKAEIASLAAEFGRVQEWSGHVPGPLTYRRGDGASLTVQTTPETTWANSDGNLSPEQIKPCQLIQILTGPSTGQLRIRADNPSIHC
ncbi:hypothetical protein ACFXHA_28795 [Nocardia sp. NPDC059240]|uniref:hypothetical protein n=1 Tax=Nocardia sp. NPDC059240 TaxID=3346786 RepID=UPI0036A81BCE